MKRRSDGATERWREWLVASVVLVLIGTTWAQETEPEEGPAQDEAPQKEETPASLDELLGIEEEEAEGGAAAANQEAEDELNRHLAEEEISNVFAAAIEKMSLSADLLDRKFDTGLGTQRIQEDIIRKLDQLIEYARSRQVSGPCSSSSTGSSPPDGSRNNPGRQQASDRGANQRNRTPSDSREGDPPPMQQGEVNTVLEETRTEWGNLPQRVREQLMQGRDEKYSSLYERLTREYYRRLAEEGSQ